MGSDASCKTDLLIIGSGPAGYTAAVYGARAGLNPVVVAGLEPGGQLTITSEIENYPGFPDPVGGPWLMEQMKLQAENVGTKIVHDLIVHASLDKGPDSKGYFSVKGDSGKLYRGRALVIATGARARWLGLPSEKRLQGKGVSACATCDGFFYRGKPVAVVGGGNTAVEEALFLSQMASHVYLIHRRDELRAEKIQRDRLQKNPKISFLPFRQVAEIIGGGEPEVVQSLLLTNPKDPSFREKLKVDGVFIAIGHEPNIGPFRGQVQCDAEGYILTSPGTARTSLPGVFAAGDIQDKTYRQAVTAAGTGCMAALEADRWLAAQAHSR